MADRLEPPATTPPYEDDRIDRAVERVVGRRGLQPRYAAYLVIVLWMVAVVGFGILERIADPKTYPTIWDAWWWAIQTVTTVGYGDIVPHQAAGKAVASVLMIGGLAFLSIVTATITSTFIEARQERARARGDDPVIQKLSQLADKVDSLEAALLRERESADETPSSP